MAQNMHYLSIKVLETYDDIAGHAGNLSIKLRELAPGQNNSLTFQAAKEPSSDSIGYLGDIAAYLKEQQEHVKELTPNISSSSEVKRQSL